MTAEVDGIPVSSSAPAMSPVPTTTTTTSSSPYSDCELVYFDLETTGLSVPPDPVQVSAVDERGLESFDQFLAPENRGSMEASAQRVTGIEVDPGRPGRLLRRGASGGVRRRVYCVGQRQGLREFLEWTRDLCRRNGRRRAVLVAYNGLKFDAKILIYHFEK